jgi:cytochrome c-type biogenesis protein CcmH
MTLWLILVAMSAAVAAVLFLGSRRRRPQAGDDAEHDLAVYRAQLRELERDRERGVIEESELAAARLEIERRLLAADSARRPDARSGGEAPRTGGWTLSLALALAVPLGAAAAYLWLGNPGIESRQFAARSGESPGTASVEGGGAPDVASMMARLRARLAEAPDDLDGWIMLGRSAAALGDYGEAIAAYSRALALDGELAHVYAALGEAQVLAAGGIVTEAARRALEQAQARDPADPRARFYLALARDQDGDKEGALAALTSLLADAPPDAAWAEGVRNRASALAAELGRDPASVLPPAGGAGPGEGDMAAAAQMSPAEQQAMIRDMVGRLAARLEDSPDDAQGWRMLGRSYGVLGEPDKSAAAFGRAAALLPEDPGAQLDYAAALLNTAGAGEPPAEAVARLEDIVAQDPANGDALYYLGEARRRQGKTAAAAELWQRLLGQLPEGSEDRAWLKTRLKALEAGDASDASD